MLGGERDLDHLPTQIGRYKVLDELALGGMAQILLCKLQGPQGFERPVVVKRILPQHARDPGFVDMFVDEARLTVGIHHSNVVQVHELCQEGHELYLVMEYLNGETLLQLVRALADTGTRLSAAIAVHVIAEVCQGLRAAHELVDADGKSRELVHRDVAPDNLFITYEGEVKILDFGIALARGRSTKTDAGSLKGKQGYMSPEQCLGLDLDRRSDIFSLGVVLFELLTGQRLFKRDSQVAAAKAICEAPIAAPSSIRPGLPSELDAICAHALERDRSRRYADIGSMRDDLLAASRLLAPSYSPRDELRTLMHGRFGERMQAKARTLRDATTRPLTRVAVGAREPTPSAGTPPPVTRSHVEGERVPARRHWLAIPLVAAALGGAAGVAWLVTRAPSSSVRVPAIQPAAPAAVRGPESGSSVTLRVDSTPPGAVVRVDQEARGVTPLDISVPRGERPLAIRLEKEGFAPKDDRVVPTEDRRVSVVLDALPAMHSNTPTKRGKSGSRGYFRWE